MNGADMAWIWGIGLIVFAFGLGAGSLMTYFLGGRRRELRAKANELQEVRSAYAGYREDVDRHFHKTGELFQQMADQYRSVYEHLAQGANTLGESRWQPAMLDLDLAGDPAETAPETAQTIPEELHGSEQSTVADDLLSETLTASELDLMQEPTESTKRDYH